MTLPNFFYTEPRCRTSSPDFGKLKGATEVTLDTPGARLWLALCYYRVEAYATRKDRDTACGPTAYEDVQYFSASGKTLSGCNITLDEIACGHSVDDPHFDTIFTPIFDAAVKRLIRDAVTAPQRPRGDDSFDDDFNRQSAIRDFSRPGRRLDKVLGRRPGSFRGGRRRPNGKNCRLHGEATDATDVAILN